jgi:DNA (cytosine-5)-methyltransferase 1
MRHGSLFSGIGGFDLASEWMGWENVFHCEWNPFGQKVLNYYWPNAISYNDITKTDFSIHRGSVDIITGGFPCQPYSMAGKRLGKEDERHLWPEMLRAIREIQPTWVVGENVLGLVNWDGGLVFHEVQADLEAQGYEVQPYVLPAASVNAPHRRDRVWFVAYSKSCSDSRNTREISRKAKEKDREWIQPGTTSKQQVQLPIESSSVFRNAANSSSIELQGSKFNGSLESKRSFQRKSGQFSRPIFSRWEKFPTQPPICNGDDGLSDRLDGITFSKWRNESIKAGGNAIVPQVVHQIFKAIQQYETTRQA